MSHIEKLFLNIAEFTGRRGLELDLTSIEQLVKTYHKEALVQLPCASAYVVIVGPMVPVSTRGRTSDFPSAARLVLEKGAKKSRMNHALIIANHIIQKRKLFQNAIAALQENMTVDVFPIHAFSCNPLKHVSVPDAVIDRDPMVNLAWTYTDPRQLKRAEEYDPQIIWLGAKPGAIVRVNGFADTSGSILDWRRVIPGRPEGPNMLRSAARKEEAQSDANSDADTLSETSTAIEDEDAESIYSEEA